MKREWWPSKEEEARARVLSEKLKSLIEYHFPRPPNAEAMKEIKQTKEELEAMGFKVASMVQLDVHTGKVFADVTLHLPEVTTIQ